eukprot:Pgem_evm1s18860
MNQVNMSNSENGFSNFKVKGCSIAQQKKQTVKTIAKPSNRKNLNIINSKTVRLPPTKKEPTSKTYTEFEFNINNVEEETQSFQFSTKRQTIAQLQKERSQQRLTQILQEKNHKYKQISKLQNRKQPQPQPQPQLQLQPQTQPYLRLQRTTSVDSFGATSTCNSKNLALSRTRSLPTNMNYLQFSNSTVPDNNNSLFEMINFNNNNCVELSLPNCIPKLNVEMEYIDNISPITTPNFLSGFINTQLIA